MIYLCDSIMGSGKSTAAINYMNARPTEKFLYVTPMNDETWRIQRACPGLNFVVPSNAAEEHQHLKREHLRDLVASGRNVSMTHSLFSLCDDDVLEKMEGQGYTLILDEAISVLQNTQIKEHDLEIALRSDWLKCDTSNFEQPQHIQFTGDGYAGDWLKDIKFYAASHPLVMMPGSDAADSSKKKAKKSLYYWMLNDRLFSVMKDVYILTYLFDGSPLSYYFQARGISYEQIGVILDDFGQHQFSMTHYYIPAYVADLKNKIHILQNKRMNDIGRCETSLSATKQTNMGSKGLSDYRCRELQANLCNFFNNIHRDKSKDQKMWTTYESLRRAVKGGGYTRLYQPFNLRATNDFRNVTVMAYCVNVYMHLSEKIYYESLGATVNERTYALSVMLQWIWRSAIRDGKEIWIYIPSARMRKLLEDWIEEVSTLASAA